MYYQQLQAFVTFSTSARAEGKPQVNARAWLSCPHCRNVVEVVGPQIILQMEKERMSQIMRSEVTDFSSQMLQEFVHRQLTAFRINQTCTECGTISALPAKDVEKMKKKLTKIITDEWLNAQIDALMMCVPFRNHQDDLAEARAMRDGESSRALLAGTTS
jgi:hypothetical protein